MKIQFHTRSSDFTSIICVRVTTDGLKLIKSTDPSDRGTGRDSITCMCLCEVRSEDNDTVNPTRLSSISPSASS